MLLGGIYVLLSKKPIEVRMGKGKGSPEYYACRVKPGRIIFEVDGVTEETKFHLRSLCAKLRELQLDNNTVPHTLLSIALDEMKNNTD